MSINNSVSNRGLGRWISYILACLGVLILILGLVFPKEIKVEETTTVNGKPNQIYNIISNIMNADKWLPSLQDRKNLTYTYSDMKFTKGAIVNYKSSTAEGAMRIDQLDSAKAIAYTLSAGGKESTLSIAMESKNAETEIRWQKSSKMSYPRNAFSPFIRYRWKKELREASILLQNEIHHRLKDSIYYGYRVRETTQNDKHFQTIRTSVSHDKFTLSYSQNIAAIYQKLSAQGVVPQGHPCAIIYGYNEASGLVDMAAAIATLSPLNVKDLTEVSFPTHNAAYIHYLGDSRNNETAHYAINDYINDRGSQTAYAAIEEYVTDPLKEKDPSKWQTNIYYYFTDKK